MDSAGSKHPLVVYRETQQPPLSQQQLAERLGVKRETVWRWEGGRPISDKYLPTVADKLGIPRRVLRPDLAALLEEAAE